jgi:hypothetical protein
MSEKQQLLVYFNSTGMNPQELAVSTENLLNQGYYFMFNHRGWLYFAQYNSNGKA